MAKRNNVVVEAEELSINGPAKIVGASFASGGAYVQGGTSGPVTMSTVFSGTAGNYDVVVRYFDEDDGRSSSSVSVDGKQVDAWTWDAGTGGPFANKNSLVERVIENVALSANSRLVVEGKGEGGEPFRVDALEFRPAAQTAIQSTSHASSPRASSDPLPAFEGAIGYGATADGGRGGDVVRVTNLQDSGQGSLRWALEDVKGPRIVIFDVGGTIELKDGIDVRGNVTVAGQTAPGEGITIAGARLRVVESDVIIRGLKLRTGEDGPASSSDKDGISVGKAGSTVERVIVDGNSLAWSVDETLATWGSPSDITFSNNIVAEGLDRSDRGGPNSFGLLIGDDTERVSVVGNLFTDNEHRNPQLKWAREIEFVNNVVYNYGDNGFESFTSSRGTTAHLIGNVFIEGRDTANNDPVRLHNMSAKTAYYLEDNLRMSEASGRASRSDIAEGKGTAGIEGKPVFRGSGVDAMASSKVLDHVLDNAGARTDERDPVDARIVGEVLKGTGRIITSQKKVPAHETPTVRTKLADRDGDGIPDVYEAIVGSNARVADANGDADGDGYTNIEDYVNGLIDGFAKPVAPPKVAPPKATVVPATPPKAAVADQAIRLELEDASHIENMRVQGAGVASDRALLRAVDGRERSVAELDFDGRDGLYDVTVNYFDETDGVSRLSLDVGGTAVGSWMWDEHRGGVLANGRTATSKTFEDVAFSDGDTIRLVGQADRKEPLRIDSVDLLRVGDLTEAPGASQGALVVEAEDVTDLTNMRVEAVKSASGGEVLRADGGGPGAFGFEFDGPSGLYRIAVDHFDETDGESRMAIEVEGRTVGRWDWDGQAGHRWATPKSQATHETAPVKLRDGDAIRLVGTADGQEPLRVDAVRFERAGAPPPEAPPAQEWRIEAEDIDALTNMEVDRNSAASGDRLIRVVGSGPAEAEFEFGGRAGRYAIEVAHFDEADGVSRLAVEVDGTLVGSWDWDQKLGHDWATASTLTSHRLEAVNLREGARITLAGEGHGDEPLRIDAVAFVPDSDLG